MYLGAVFIDILLNEYFPKFVFNKNLSFNTEHELMFVCFNPGFTSEHLLGLEFFSTSQRWFWHSTLTHTSKIAASADMRFSFW